MNHPRYDKSDPKAGQPVLIGDEFYWATAMSEQAHGPCVAISILRVGVGVSLACHIGSHSLFFSAPPAPKIEACKCGRGCDSTPSSVRVDGDSAPNHPYGQWWVVCAQCHRRGPMVTGRGPAIAAWNADQRKLKV
jgi:hypothetical protein